jgi:hypothetical protein
MSRADKSTREWPESNVSKLLARIALHAPELLPLKRGTKIHHGEFCSSHKRSFTCDCDPSILVNGKIYS